MKILFFLIFTALTFGQPDLLLLMGDDAADVAQEAYDTYYDRVTAAGGIIIDPDHTLALIQDAVDNGYWDDTYLLLDSRGGFKYAIEPAILTWYDIKNNNDFGRANVGTEPNFFAADSSFIFDDDRLKNTTKANWIFLHSSASSVFINASIGFTADTDSLWALLSTNGYGTTQSGITFGSDSRTTSDGKVACYAGSGTAIVMQNISADAFFPMQTWGVLTAITDPTNATGALRQYLYFNNAGATNDNSRTGAVSTSESINDFMIGASSGGSSNILHGYIKTILIMKALASTAQRTSIYNAIK